MNENQWSVLKSCHATDGKNCVVSRERGTLKSRKTSSLPEGRIVVYLCADVVTSKHITYSRALNKPDGPTKLQPGLEEIIVMTYLICFVP